MKTFSKFTALALVALVAALPTQALAWDYTTNYVTPRANPSTGKSVVQYTTTDVCIGLRIRFEGSAALIAAGPTVELDATGDIIFTTDGTTADTTVGDGDAATTDGKIDVSNAAYNTAGETCDDINASALWECTLVGMLPTDSIDNVVVVTAETSTSTGLSATAIAGMTRHGIFDEEGLEVAIATADSDNLSLVIGPENLSDAYLPISSDLLADRRSSPTSEREKHWTNELEYAYSAGATGSSLSVYAVYGTGASATVEKLWSQTAASSGAPSATAINSIDLRQAANKIRQNPGWKLLVRYDKLGSAITTGTLQVSGLSYATGIGPVNLP